MKLLFTLSVFAIFYAYIGYPLSLLAVSLLRRRSVVKKPITPLVTMIITAYNEEQRIEEKLINTLALSYPREKLEIIVASDGSSDNTNAIVEGYASQGINLLALESRRGKENAQKAAIEKASGDILVFSDVATQIGPDGLQEMVKNFADPSVGCVSSEDRLITKDGSPSGEGFYVKYEMMLRKLETVTNSLVGLSGSFFAARKEVFYDFSGNMQSDFRTLLNSIRIGLRGVCDPMSIGYYYDVGGHSSEFERKVRTVVRGLTVFFNHLEYLEFKRYGLFAYQYLCHKLMRWLVPVFLITVFVSNIIILSDAAFYLIIFICQLVFYGAAMTGCCSQTIRQKIWIKIPFYFVTVNTSIIVAWFRFLKGERIVMWQPSKR